MSEQARTSDYVLCLSVDDACKALGIKRTKLYELVADGEVKSVMIGGRRVFRKKDLEAFVEMCAARTDREELDKVNQWRCKSCGATNMKSFGICMGCTADEPRNADH